MSGLEGILSGTPTYRLVPSDRLGIDTLPGACEAATVSAENLGETLDSNAPPPTVRWDELFSDVDVSVWRRHLFSDNKAQE